MLRAISMLILKAECINNLDSDPISQKPLIQKTCRYDRDRFRLGVYRITRDIIIFNVCNFVTDLNP